MLVKAQPGHSKQSLSGSSVSVGTPSRKRQKNDEEMPSGGLDDVASGEIRYQCCFCKFL